MLRIDKEKIKDVAHVEFQNETYYVVDEMAKYLNENLKDVEGITLPVAGEYKKTATIEQIEKGRKEEPLSEFNKALMKMRENKK